MKQLNQAFIDHMADGRPIIGHYLVWLGMRDRTTGDMTYDGVWSGLRDISLQVDGETRTYQAAGALLEVEKPPQDQSFNVARWRINLSPLADPTVQAFRAFDPKFSPIEVHEWYWSGLTYEPLDNPRRTLKGTITHVTDNTAAEGGESFIEVEASSAVWRLQQGLTLKKSDRALRQRQPGDRFRQYNDISGSISTPWGEEMGKGSDGNASGVSGLIGKNIVKVLRGG